MNYQKYEKKQMKGHLKIDKLLLGSILDFRVMFLNFTHHAEHIYITLATVVVYWLFCP